MSSLLHVKHEVPHFELRNYLNLLNSRLLCASFSQSRCGVWCHITCCAVAWGDKYANDMLNLTYVNNMLNFGVCERYVDERPLNARANAAKRASTKCGVACNMLRCVVWGGSVLCIVFACLMLGYT